MKNYTFSVTLLLFMAFSSLAQKSALILSTFSRNSNKLIISALNFDFNLNKDIIKDKGKVRARRFKNMTVDKDSTYYDVEISACFPDGQESLKRFISQNVIRPKNSRGETVLVRFMVERYGEISKVHVLASGSNPMLSAEAIRVVKKMGSWNPAKIQGIEVASYYVLPIKF